MVLVSINFHQLKSLKMLFEIGEITLVIFYQKRNNEMFQITIEN